MSYLHYSEEKQATLLRNMGLSLRGFRSGFKTSPSGLNRELLRSKGNLQHPPLEIRDSPLRSMSALKRRNGIDDMGVSSRIGSEPRILNGLSSSYDRARMHSLLGSRPRPTSIWERIQGKFQ